MLLRSPKHLKCLQIKIIIHSYLFILLSTVLTHSMCDKNFQKCALSILKQLLFSFIIVLYIYIFSLVHPNSKTAERGIIQLKKDQL